MTITPNTPDKLFTPVGRFSYPNLAKPTSSNGTDFRYSVDLLFEKTKVENDPMFLEIKRITEAAAIQKFGAIHPGIITGIRDGDKKLRSDGSQNPHYVGMYYISFKSMFVIPVVDTNNRLLDFVSDPDAVVGGDYGRAQVNPKIGTYDVKMGKKGVSVYPILMQLTGKTDKPFSGPAFDPNVFDNVPY